MAYTIIVKQYQKRNSEGCRVDTYRGASTADLFFKKVKG